MIELGKVQKLKVVKLTDFGVYLGDEKERILLPKKQVPENTAIGSELTVFVYRDSEDRLISTTNMPKFTLGEVARLKVNDVTKIGAFLDWGLEKDLFLSFKEMTTRVEPGKEYLVALYIDKSSRLAATMKVYPYLKLAGDYEVDDVVEGIIYEIPWIMGTALVNVGSLGSIYATVCIVLMFVAIVRSIWVAVKLCDVYDNQERYRVQTTIVNNSNPVSQNDSFPVIPACCAGLILMFIAFGIISTF